MEITPAWVGVCISGGVAVGGVLVRWVHGALKEQREDFAAAISGGKETSKLLFDKHDELVSQLQEHRLHVAETYVNREVLKEQLAPINRTLEEIKDELREERKNK